MFITPLPVAVHLESGPIHGRIRGRNPKACWVTSHSSGIATAENADQTDKASSRKGDAECQLKEYRSNIDFGEEFVSF